MNVIAENSAKEHGTPTGDQFGKFLKGVFRYDRDRPGTCLTEQGTWHFGGGEPLTLDGRKPTAQEVSEFRRILGFE